MPHNTGATIRAKGGGDRTRIPVELESWQTFFEIFFLFSFSCKKNRNWQQLQDGELSSTSTRIEIFSREKEKGIDTSQTGGVQDY